MRIWYILCVLAATLQYYSDARIFDSEIDDTVTIMDRNEILARKIHQNRVKRDVEAPPKNKRVPKKSEYIFHRDDNNVAFVYWKHTIDGVVFLLTCESANVSNNNKLSSKGCNSVSNIYRSPDDGKSFSLQNGLFKGAFLHTLYLTPLDRRQKIVTDYMNKTIYITRDNGLSFEKIKTPFAPTFLYRHPTRIGYIAGYDETPDGDKSLYISKDNGRSWTLVTRGVRNYFWAGEKSNSTDIYVEKQSGNQIEKQVQSSYLSVAKEPYKKIERVSSQDLVPFSVFVGNEYIVVQQFVDKDFYVSYKGGSFTKITYDKKYLKKSVHQTILSYKNSELLLGIIHPDNTATLYLSDSTGKHMQFIQSNVVMEQIKNLGVTPKIDFAELRSSVGTYIVNKKNEGTLISHDKGYHWNKTMVESSPRCKSDTNTCEMVLYIKIDHPFSEFTAPLVTKASAPDVVIAQGYYGKKIETDYTLEPNRVFMSVDGGRTWSEQLSSMFGYAILDHGGLIAATPLTYTIDHGLSYTLDYGQTWQEVSMTKRYSRIAAIITETSAKTLQLNVFGFLQDQPFISNGKGNTWIVWQFNFTSCFEGLCKPTDYQEWKHTPKCILGQSVTSIRRNPKSLCLNGKEFTNNLTTTPCKCTADDYHCDVGYYRKNGLCLPFKFKKHHVNDVPVNCEGTYSKSRGYVKKYGVRCEGGEESNLEPITTKCPTSPQLPPMILRIKMSEHPAVVYRQVGFKVMMARATHKTEYTWDFGDDKQKLSGLYTDMLYVKHVFSKSGEYVVSVRANDPQVGSTTKSIKVRVVDDILKNGRIFFAEPVVVNRDVEFRVVRSEDRVELSSELEESHFLWSFDSTYSSGHQGHAVYNFKEAGLSKVEVQLVTPVHYREFNAEVRVFVRVIAINIRLRTPKPTDKLFANDGVMQKLQEFLLETEVVDVERITVKGDDMPEKQLRVYIGDTKTTADSENGNARNVAQRLVSMINKQEPTIDENVRLFDARIISCEHSDKSIRTGDKDVGNNKTLIVTLVCSVLVFLVIGVAIGFYRYRRFYMRKPSDDNMNTELILEMEDEFK